MGFFSSVLIFDDSFGTAIFLFGLRSQYKHLFYLSINIQKT
ncbi:hypothetical protein CKA32_005796 [Geitlerinema sp. FC II]|nr:hypothetical protein CKA32_005796 [Geitlerinema sp. FC II]